MKEKVWSSAGMDIFSCSKFQEFKVRKATEKNNLKNALTLATETLMFSATFLSLRMSGTVMDTKRPPVLGESREKL